jgi:cystathionine beta-lyase/cystathionine gamma-synthase
MHSATKFIAGHSDLMAGILAVKGERSVLSPSLLLLTSNNHTDDHVSSSVAIAVCTFITTHSYLSVSLGKYYSLVRW